MSASFPPPQLPPEVKVSLQQRMTLILSGIIIGLLMLVGLPIIGITVQIQQQETAREQQVLANQVARSVSNILQSIQSDQLQLTALLETDPRTSLMSTQISNLVNLTVAATAGNVRETLGRGGSLETLLAAQNTILGVNIVGVDGQLQRSLWRSPELAESVDPVTAESLRQAQNGVATLDSLVIGTNNLPMLLLAIPIEATPGGDSVVPVAVVWVDMQNIWPYLTDLQVGQTGYLYLIDQDNSLVAAPAIMAANPVPDLSINPPRSGSYRGLNNEAVIGRIAPISNTPWWVVIEIPSAEANASLRSLLLILGAILAFGMGIAILVARLFSQWLLAPIDTLQAGATRIIEGDLAYRVELPRNDELGLLARLTNQMVATLEQTITELRTMSLRLISVQEAERQRIARQLHDELGQSLTALRLNLWMSMRTYPEDETLAQAHDLSIAVQETARNLSHELRPAMLDDLGLIPTLNWLIDRVEQRANLAISLEDHLDETQLAAETKTTLYRLVAEALTNISKHARASSANIELSREQDQIWLRISDDGVGFDPDILQQTQSLGIDGMRERVNLLRGRFRIESEPNCGTNITVCLPTE